jgi:ATP-dependent helicase HrpA/adenine-specific DNA-methyltransferase
VTDDSREAFIMHDEPRLKAFARRMRREPTPSEKRLWQILRGRRFAGFKFRRQHWFAPYIAVFYCPAAMLVVEMDGDSHAENGAAEADAERQAFLESLGLKVPRFWDAELFENEDGVLETIWWECSERVRI